MTFALLSICVGYKSGSVEQYSMFVELITVGLL